MAYDRYLHVSYENPGKYSRVPNIRLKGKWLKKAGFNIGDIVKVTVDESNLQIKNDTKNQYSPLKTFSNKTKSLENIVASSEMGKSAYHKNGYEGYTVSLSLNRNNGYTPVQINNSKTAYEFLQSLQYESREVLLSVMLDTKNKVVGVYDIGKGSIKDVSSSPREAIKAAILANCSALILAHNHPSGDVTEPSRADIHFTEKMYEAANVMDIVLYDHIIIGSNRYSSLREMGYINDT